MEINIEKQHSKIYPHVNLQISWTIHLIVHAGAPLENSLQLMNQGTQNA